MVIKASSGKEIDALVGDLASEVSVRRDAAIARLTVIGARAVERLIRLASSRTAAPSARISAFRTLESIADARALETALEAFADSDNTVAIAALSVARAFLQTPLGVRALDHVTSVALDRTRPAPVRLAAVQALSDLAPDTMKPVLTALQADPDPAVARAVDTGGRRGASVDTTERLRAAAEGALTGDPAALRRAIARASAEVPISTLQQIVERVRVQEGIEPTSRRTAWMAVRGAAHAALAQRSSRLALYDLRETIEKARQPVPGEFLTALTAIGDASCLEPIAAAYAHAGINGQSPGDWWQRHLADAFRTIMGREKITRRHAVIKRIEKRWPGVFQSIVDSR